MLMRQEGADGSLGGEHGQLGAHRLRSLHGLLAALFTCPQRELNASDLEHRLRTPNFNILILILKKQVTKGGSEDLSFEVFDVFVAILFCWGGAEVQFPLARACFLVSSMPFHTNFLEFMLKWQRLLSGLLRPLFVWNLVRRDWYYDHLHDDRVLTHTCLSFFRLPLPRLDLPVCVS